MVASPPGPQFFRALAVAVALGLFTAGCVVGVDTPASGPPPSRPDARDETPPPRPSSCAPECRWSPGYWHWDGTNQVWVAGHWERSSSTRALGADTE
jgi:hypothetical protein